MGCRPHHSDLVPGDLICWWWSLAAAAYLNRGSPDPTRPFARWATTVRLRPVSNRDRRQG